MTTYQMLEEQIHSREAGTYISYGICAVAENKKIIAKISDVFLDKDKTSNIVNLCNDLQLDVIHLHDIIDDYM